MVKTPKHFAGKNQYEVRNCNPVFGGSCQYNSLRCDDEEEFQLQIYALRGHKEFST